MEPDHIFQVHAEEAVGKLGPQVVFAGKGESVYVLDSLNTFRLDFFVGKNLAVVRGLARLGYRPLQSLQLQCFEGFRGHGFQFSIPVHSHQILFSGELSWPLQKLAPNKNPKSEARSTKQIRITKIVLRTPHPSGGAPVSNDQNKK